MSIPKIYLKMIRQLAFRQVYRGGSVSGLNILRFAELDQHLGGRVDDLHAVQDGGPVVGDGHVAPGVLDHLVHALRPETGPDGVAQGFGRLDVGAPDLCRLARLALHEPGTGVLGDGHREVLDQLQRSRLKIETRKTSFRTCLS